MKLNINEYKDKLYACWVGKNIGGTMGTPYEGGREYLDIKGFVTKPNEVLPNDDLDLQLVWLHCIEKTGPYNIDAKKLGEFWLSYIVPYWNEYGIGKVNMRRGLIPPLSGDYQNTWKDSNGAWIRTEIWASLCPGRPDLAAKYAIEDAMVDHGSGEGTIAAAFVAAMQSAAFVEKDLRKIINIGLANVPKESRLAKSIVKTIECYEAGMTPKEARDTILNMNADMGDGWFEAPSNVAYTVLGLLYGEGDFKKSMITAINCGDDTDCTGATVGSTLGILGGMNAIPADWKSYIGDKLVTISLAGGVLYGAPKTCTELTERVLRIAPHVLFANNADVKFTDEETYIPEGYSEKYFTSSIVLNRIADIKPYTFDVDSAYLKAIVTYDGAPDIAPNGQKKVHIKFVNNADVYGNIPYFINLRFWTPEGFKIEGPKSIRLPHVNSHYNGTYEADYIVTAGDIVNDKNRVVIEATSDERGACMYIPLVILGE